MQKFPRVPGETFEEYQQRRRQWMIANLSARKKSEPMIVEKKMADEKQGLFDAITSCNGDVTAAAKLIGMSRATAYRKCKVYGINRDQIGANPCMKIS